MAIIGSKLKRPRIEDEEDRFTTLPDSIAHHILSYLTNIEDIARLCFTSKRCENLCLSLPSLVINDVLSSYNLDAGSARKSRFLDFLVSLITRRRSAKITSLTICCHLDGLTCSETYRIMSMLSSAIQSDVSEVNLKLRLESQVFVIPLDLFHNESLRSLKVNLMMGKLELPCPYGFSLLQSLHLEQVAIDHEDVGKWISSFCKCLKDLCVEHLSGITKFQISSSSLEIIEIRNCSLHHLDISAQSLIIIRISRPCCSSIKASLNIYAPRVRSLTLVNFSPSNYFSLGKMNLLKLVSLSLSSGVSKSLLQSIAQTQLLSISCQCIKTVYDDASHLPFTFNKLQTLTLCHNGLTDDVVPSIAMFFQELQLHLKALCIEASSTYKVGTKLSATSTSGYGLRFWESQNILFLCGLKEIEIELLGGKNEEGLLENILNKAKTLKRIIISCGSTLPAQIASKLITLGSDSNFQSKGGNILLKSKP